MRDRPTVTGWAKVLALALALASLAACEAVKASEDKCPTCDSNATCQGTTCVCSTGWMGDGETCTDVNECQADNGGCDENATCSNTDGSRDCMCRPGFVGNGVTCREKWLKLGTFPDVDIDPENFGTKATAVGSLVLFGPEANGIGVPFMRAFDTTQMTVSPPLALPADPQTDFCACGLTDAFVGTGNDLFMLGNNGQRYTPSVNRWVQVNSYTDPFRRGEAAAAFDPERSVIYLVGGRNTETTSIQMDVTQFNFSNLTGTVPFPAELAKAWVFSGDHLLYVAGGDGVNGRQLASLDPTGFSGAWSLLAEAPSELGRALGMGEFEGRLWVATSGGLFFYRPMTGVWDGFVTAPATGLKAVTVAGTSTYALCKTASGLEIYKLNAIE